MCKSKELRFFFSRGFCRFACRVLVSRVVLVSSQPVLFLLCCAREGGARGFPAV